MATDRTKLLVHVRRISSLFEKAFREGPDGSLDGKFAHEQPVFVHHALVFYLAGCMAYLENEGSVKSWEIRGTQHSDFDTFISSQQIDHPFRTNNISKAHLNALLCIRNACVHNSDDLSLNQDRSSTNKVQNVGIAGVVLAGTKVSLQPEFLEFVRLATLAVRKYHGDS
jgi:hypothetical protein